MKVLFVKDLRGQGKKGDIKEVKSGYAQNYLIKNGYAVQLNEQTLSKYNKEQEKIKQEDISNRELAKKIKTKLEKEELSFKVRVGAQDKVFGRISPKQIKEELDKLGYNIDKKQISNAENASSLGYHNVEVILYKDVIANLRIKLEK